MFGKKVRLSVLYVLCLLVTGCSATKISDLQPIEENKFIVLDKDYVRVQIRGVFDFKWLEGLKSGKYTAIAEDDNGVYFLSEVESVIIVANDEADYYLEYGYLPESTMLDLNRLPRAINFGGLWLPKGDQGKPQLFYLFSNPTDGSDFGWLGREIVNDSEGGLVFIPFDSEQEFIDSLVIHESN